MHEDIVHVLVRVLLAGQSNKAVLENENSHGVNYTSDQDVNSEVELVLIQKSRVFNVLLDHVGAVHTKSGLLA